LGATTLDDSTVDETLGCVLKDEADIRIVRSAIQGSGVEAFVAGGAA
jgi:hypothetical protein